MTPPLIPAKKPGLSALRMFTAPPNSQRSALAPQASAPTKVFLTNPPATSPSSPSGDAYVNSGLAPDESNPYFRAEARGMWVWHTQEVIKSPEKRQAVLKNAQSLNMTDLYVYLDAGDYAGYGACLGTFNAEAGQMGMSVWALEGARAYFSDADGPAEFYRNIQECILFNEKVSSNQRFIGFHADNEPQDSAQFKPTFHNAIPESQLSKEEGTGVWYASEYLDREMLMRDWLDTYSTAKKTLHTHGLKFGAAVPCWTMDYYGEVIAVNFPFEHSQRQSVTKVLMNVLDDLVIMTYNTDPKNAANRAIEQLKYAAALPQEVKPRIFASVETHSGVGENVSYADTPKKAAKSHVIHDLGIITGILQKHSTFTGMVIHDAEGWEDLPS